eukprot:5880860-Pyramimonas_sp.AAC.1
MGRYSLLPFHGVKAHAESRRWTARDPWRLASGCQSPRAFRPLKALEPTPSKPKRLSARPPAPRVPASPRNAPEALKVAPPAARCPSTYTRR